MSVAAPPKVQIPILTRLSDVTPEETQFLWPGRIPVGKITIVMGDPGTGKTNLTLDIAARVTTGRPWPNGGTPTKGSVIILTGEDGLADTVRPRLDVMGGDPKCVFALEGVKTPAGKTDTFDLEKSLDALQTAIRETSASLVIVDPVSAFMGKTDTHRDSDVRRILTPLASLAEKFKVSVVGIMHLNKDEQKRALYRGQGTIAFQAAARAVHVVARDEEDPERFLFLPAKMNLTQHPPGLAYRIESVSHPLGFSVGCVKWESDPVSVSLDDVLVPPETNEDRSSRQEAEDFLEKLLKDGAVPKQTVETEARKVPIALRTLKRAKQSLGVRSIKRPCWWEWELPGNQGGHQGGHGPLA